MLEVALTGLTINAPFVDPDPAIPVNAYFASEVALVKLTVKLLIREIVLLVIIFRKFLQIFDLHILI